MQSNSNKYEIGDVISNRHGNLFEIIDNKSNMYYTLYKVENGKYIELLKGQVEDSRNAKISIISILKKL